MFRFVLPLLALLLAAPALAQESSRIQRFRLAQQLVEAGQTDRGISLLEDLIDEDPTDYGVYVQLRRAYQSERRFDDAIATIGSIADRTGPSPTLFADRGLFLHLLGRSTEARAAWAEAIALEPNQPRVYRTVQVAQFRSGLYDEAAQTLEAGRAALGLPGLFRADLAQAYGLAGAWERAASEYIALVLEEPGQSGFVQTEMSRLSDGEGALDAFAQAVDAAVRNEPLNQPVRELAAWIALERGDWPAALDAHRAIDRLMDREGRALLAFAATAQSGGALDEAEAAYAHVLGTYPDGAVAPLARLGLARLQAQRADRAGEVPGSPTPFADASAGHFADFAARYPGDPNLAAVLYEAAAVHRVHRGDYARADSLLRRIVALGEAPGALLPLVQQVPRARLALGEGAILNGDLDAARAAFVRVEDQVRTGEAAEAARLEIARIAYYRGHFATALGRLRAMNENTASDVANDAIELKLLLQENGGPDSLSQPLGAHARAALLHRQRRDGEALAVLDSLLDILDDHPLVDEATFLRARVLRRLGRTDEALDGFRAVEREHAGSYLADRAAFLIAETLEQDLDDTAGALEGYARLLADYPGSLQAPEARARIRRLRGDAVPPVEDRSGPPG